MYLSSSAPSWLNTSESLVAMQRLPNDLSRSEVYESALYLNLLVPHMDSLNNEKAVALEFGSGWGEGLIALNAFARAYGIRKVRGSELSAPRRLRAHEIATQFSLVDPTIVPEGFSMLAKCKNKAVVVVASTAGPASEVSVERLVESSLESLTLGGLFLIYSDSSTMSEVAEVLRRTKTNRGQLIEGSGITTGGQGTTRKPYCIMKK